MNILDVKLLRDIWKMRTQVLTISLLIASGAAIFIMSVSNYFALVTAMEQHYREERFGDLFANLTRAPNSILQKLETIDGVGLVQPRISKVVRVIRPDTTLPISGRILSLPQSGEVRLNKIKIIEGRLPEQGHDDEVVINQAYAQARGIRPNDTIDIVLNSRLQRFHIVGIALSPEFVFATRAALPLPDDRNLVIIWANENAVASAYDMSGAFNDVVMTLAPQAIKAQVMAEVDRLLEPYGSLRTYDRSDHPSHRFLQDELIEQETLSIVMPAIFFLIAAFILHVILSRMVEAQRDQIASLKALGFRTAPIIFHYLKFVTLIALLGSVIGIVLGYLLALGIIQSYRAFFRFPVLEAQLVPWAVVLSFFTSLLVSTTAAAAAVYRIAKLKPAEALRGGVPLKTLWIPKFQTAISSHVPVQAIMLMRNLIGRPFRTFFTIIGIGLAVPLILFGLFWFDSLKYMIDVSFNRIERGDVVVSFSEPVAARALYEFRSIPGIINAEPQRNVPIELSTAHRKYRTVLTGLVPTSELRIPRSQNLKPTGIPPSGIMLSRSLANILGVTVGSSVNVQILDEKQISKDLIITRLSDDLLGFSAIIDLAEMNKVLQEGPVINGASLKVDPRMADQLWPKLRDIPKIESSSIKALWIALFDQTIARLILISAVILSSFGVLIAIGVVYNSARVSFHERAWELAGLRVLGFKKAEVNILFLTELFIMVLIAIPIGLITGYKLIEFVLNIRAREAFRIPVAIEPQTYAIAAGIVLAAAGLSAFVMRERINAIDLVTALKSHE
ncbi:MAG: ABC transporter permease [Hyphomicrobium sp.]